MEAFNTKLDMHGMRVTVMGLGLHSGGLASTLFCIQQGADLTVTDYQDSKTLAPSIEQLSAYNIRFVLGKHEKEDFINADLVIKGPSVPRTSPFLEYARHVETDLSLFFRMGRGRLIAITGTKGKSTSAAIAKHCLQETGQRCWLLGNIRQSPLQVWAEIQLNDWLVMELSSFQLGDLAWLKGRNQSLFGDFVFNPEIGLITNMSADHLDYYPDFESYRNDKLFLVQAQHPEAWAIINDSELCAPFVKHTRAKTALFGKTALSDQQCHAAWYESSNKKNHIFIRRAEKHPNTAISYKTETIRVQPKSLMSERHIENAAGVALALSVSGMSAENIEHGINTFPGIPHRLEFIATVNSVDYINDSAATVPEATLAALQCFDRPIILIAGGSSKGGDISLFATIARKTKQIILLDGNASNTIIEHLRQHSLPFAGCYSTMKAAVEQARNNALAGDVILLSPGAASFGMFSNAYERGECFRSEVKAL